MPSYGNALWRTPLVHASQLATLSVGSEGCRRSFDENHFGEHEAELASLRTRADPE